MPVLKKHRRLALKGVADELKDPAEDKEPDGEHPKAGMPEELPREGGSFRLQHGAWGTWGHSTSGESRRLNFHGLVSGRWLVTEHCGADRTKHEGEALIP
jgi:hypothetical protein